MSSWSTNIIIVITAEIRKFMEIPANKRVVVCIRLPAWASFIMIKTVSNAVTNAIKVTPNTIISSPKTMASDAPSDAPEDTPKIYGSERGLRKMAWYAQPHTASVLPAIMHIKTLGMRML